MRRIVGIDVARGLAVLGMMTAHVGPDDPYGFSELADGRPASLFVVLAGLSLGLLSGGAVTGDRDPARPGARPDPGAGAAAVRARGAAGPARDARRRDPADVRPALRARVPRAALVAGGAAHGGRAWSPCSGRRSARPSPPSWRAGPPRRSSPSRPGTSTPRSSGSRTCWSGSRSAAATCATAGCARVGALVGVGLVILGHGGSWVALHVLHWPIGLATSEPHSSTTFEVVGNVGVALLVIAASLAARRALAGRPRAAGRRRVARAHRLHRARRRHRGPRADRRLRPDRRGLARVRAHDGRAVLAVGRRPSGAGRSSGCCTGCRRGRPTWRRTSLPADQPVSR